MFYGVNAHFQNGRAERKIRDLQDGVRTSLLHAIKKWPSTITINSWLYSFRYANNVNNHIPVKGESRSPIELFSSTIMKLPIRQFYHFGCPVYVLNGIGFSPQHAKSIHLVLSLQSGCVSPQFHCMFDNNFETPKEYNPPESLWQIKAHFIAKSNTMIQVGRLLASNTSPTAE